MVESRVDAAQKLAAVVRQFGLRFGLYQQVLADAVDMHPTDMAALMAVEAAGELTAGELAEALGLTSGAATGVVDRLVNAGGVQRMADPLDRRRVLISPLEGGSDAAVLGARLAVDLASRLNVRDAQEALRLLEVVSETLAAQIGALRGDDQAEDSLDDLTVSAPIGTTTRARLEISPSSAAIALDALRDGEDLFRAQYTRDRPTVTVRDGSVVMRFAPKRVEGRLAAISLARAPSWSLRLRGGAATVRAELSQLVVRRLTVMGGTHDLDVALPATTRRTPVRISGGKNRVNLRLPARTPVQITSRGADNRVVVKHDAIAPVAANRWATPSFDDAKPGYFVSVFAGANTVTVTR